MVPDIAPVVGSKDNVPSPACVAACCCAACANALCCATPGANLEVSSALLTSVCPVNSFKYFFAPSSNIGAGCVILVIVSAFILPVIPIFSLCHTFF